jgi:CBS domain containing-hemolysin-like protein
MIFFFALVLLLALSAFLSGAEAALTALSTLRMKKLAHLRPRLAPLFREWLTAPHRILTTVLVLNSLFNSGFSSLLALWAAPLSDRVPWPGVVGFAVWLTAAALLVGVGEIVPKVLGRAYRERVSEATLPALSAISGALSIVWRPVGWLMEKVSPALTQAPVAKLTELSLDELRHVLTESQARGQVPQDAGDMIRRLLDLDKKRAADLMVPAGRVDMLPLELAEAGPQGAELFLGRLAESGRTRLPVTSGGRPVGYLNVLDVLGRSDGGRALPPRDLLRPLRRVPAGMSVPPLLDDFRRGGPPLAVVEGARGEFLGLLTLEDLLEEIVGDILDEFDVERAVR